MDRSIETFVSIALAKIKEFVYNNIVCQYEVPHTIVSDNDEQFNCNKFREFCDNLQIKKVFSSVARPQANGQLRLLTR